MSIFDLSNNDDRQEGFEDGKNSDFIDKDVHGMFGNIIHSDEYNKGWEDGVDEQE